MELGKFYGIGVGPGDPGLMTVKGAQVLAACRHVFVPKARAKSESVALRIARDYVGPDASVHEVLFPMIEDQDELKLHWGQAAKKIAEVLAAGEDACFLTLGDTLLYSTYIYLARALKDLLPNADVITIPGINSFSAAAALTGFPLGEGKRPLLVIPASDELGSVREALDQDCTVVLMKVGERLRDILDALEQRGLLEQSVFVARAGMEGERIETDLALLKDGNEKTGYLSVILVDAHGKEEK